ncbi:MAG: ATP-binding protein, partial [Candidatus Methanomethylophilaceae archaeon]|nr:ATP-binding protein [Candidatus Methanomethylophilaceae archaeon]
MDEMEFVGRDRELSILKDEYTAKRSFILMTGRRRVGKTRLIKEFIKDRDSMYFFCSNINS